MKLAIRWTSAKLGPLCSKIGSGFTPRGGESVYTQDGTALIRSQNVYNSEFTSDGLAYIDDKQAEKMKGVTVEPIDILLNITGDSVARCCLVPGYALPARVNQHVSIIRPEPNQLLPRFLMYYLVSPYMQAYMLSLAGSGGTRKALTKGMIEEFDVSFPSPNEQQRISSILSAYDDLIENNQRRMQLLEQAARLLYKEWFVRLRFPGHEHVKIKDGVPEGWERVSLSQMCMDVRQQVDPSKIEPDTPYVGLEHIPRRSITLQDWGRASDIESSKFMFNAGDILFGKIRPYFHKVVFTLTDGIASSDAIVIRPNGNWLYEYVLFLISSDEFVALASKTVREGSKMPRADWKFLSSYSFLCPPQEMAFAFSETTSSIVSQLRVLALQNRQLAKARDLLLPRLMNGEIAV